MSDTIAVVTLRDSMMFLSQQAQKHLSDAEHAAGNGWYRKADESMIKRQVCLNLVSMIHDLAQRVPADTVSHKLAEVGE